MIHAAAAGRARPAKLKIDPRTVGQVFTAPARERVPAVDVRHRDPAVLRCRARQRGTTDPAHYDYRRAALDALHFSKLCGRLWANLRRCAGFNVQYFSAIEAQRRLAPHLHATIRGAIPRAVFRQVVEATYYALWWPSFDQAVYVDRLPEWTGPEHGYADPDTGEVLPTWDQALDQVDTDPDAKPAHVMRFGKQLDLQGVIPEHADQAVRYLAKYLTKAIGETHTDGADPAYAGTSTGCMPNSGGCRARRGARTGSATASNPITPARPDPRPVPAAGPRPGQPRRQPPRPAVPAVVRQDRRPAQSRPR